MEPAIAAIVGFGGALLGAVVGFLGALCMDTRRTHRTRTGVVRALTSELKQNAATIVLGLYVGQKPTTECSSEMWRAAKFELAQFLDEVLYEEIDFLYTMLPAVESLSSHGSATKDTEVQCQKWLKRARKAMNALRQLPEVSKFRSKAPELLAELEDVAKKARSEGEGTADKAKPSE